MPDEPYLIPDWKTTRHMISDHLEHLVLDAGDGLGGIAPHVALLGAFEKMVEWILRQKDPEHYFVCWSW